MSYRFSSIALAAIALACSACTVGPNYHKPPVTVPPAFKEQPPPGSEADKWKPAQPQDASPRGDWWAAYGDPQLAALETQVATGNQTLAQAEARFAAARAAVLGARAPLVPTVTAGANASRSHSSSNRSLARKGLTVITTTDYQLPIDISYELDLWGRVRRGVEAGVATAQASAADVATSRLSLQAELAVDYFQLRGLDAQKHLLDSTIEAFQQALQLTVDRHNQGVASGVDVAQAQTVLETARAQATDLGVARAQFEHAIAVLVGRPPSTFSLALAADAVAPPQVPAGLPSQLLERRPDVAAFERRMAASNAGIGVARAAYFPTLSLSATGGLESSTLADLVTLPSRFWSLGPSLVATAIDGGRRRSATEQARAAYDEAVAAYRQSVLGAFEDVEDNLAALRILGQEASEQDAAVKASEHALSLAVSRYKGGLTAYLEVITAQTTALANQRTAIEILTRRMVASVQLVKALGGGWSVSDLAAAGTAPKLAPAAAGKPSGVPR